MTERATGPEPPRGSDWLAHRARVSPEATALVATGNQTDPSDATWTYAELDSAVEVTAGRLAGLGVGEGDHLGVLMETRGEFVRLVHAAMRLGAVLVPLNARLARPELSRQAATADLDLLVCERETEADAVAAAEAVPEDVETVAETPVVSVDLPGGTSGTEVALQNRESAEFAPAEWSREDAQALLFTSGTTGDPKAVELTMGNFLASATASAFRLGVAPGDRWLLCLSMYHMGGLSIVLRAALYGATVVLHETRSEFDAGRTAATIEAYDVTGVSLVPTMLRRMLDSAGELANSLGFVLLGGAPASEELIDRCEALDVPVHPTYGMTETASQITTARPAEAFEHRGTVGRPLLWTEVTVVDGDGTPLPAGEVGELVVSGPTVTRSYYGDSVATEEAFGEHGLHTGDVGYRDEAGRIWVLDRRADRIVTGGENVHPGEVVEVLCDHPGVRNAAVVGLPDEEWGERVAALVVPESGADLSDVDSSDAGQSDEDRSDGAQSDPDLSVEDLEAHCEGRLAGYKRPRTIDFAEELPRTASGTVEREAVREHFEE
jgi:O-succinylbenzoic acid--CoA ligase